MADDIHLKAIFPLDDTNGSVRAINPAQTGRNIVLNPGFDSALYWTLGDGISITDGKLVFSASSLSAYQNIPVVFGADYTCTVTISGYVSGTLWMLVGNGAYETLPASNGTHTFTITAEGSSARVTFLVPGGTWTGSIDDVSVRRVVTENELDGTATNNGAVQNRPLSNGARGYLYDDAIDYTNVYSSVLNDVMDQNATALVMLIEASEAATWTDETARWVANFGSDATGYQDWIAVQTDGKRGLLISITREDGSQKLVRVDVDTQRTILLHIIVDHANDAFKVFVNGAQYGATRTGFGLVTHQLITRQVIGRQTTSAGIGAFGLVSTVAVLAPNRPDAAIAQDAREAGVWGQAAGALAGTDAIFICCIGDSITQGEGAAMGYPERLPGLIANTEIYNDGVGGIKTEDILIREPLYLDPKAESARTNQFAMYLAGTNDIGQGVALATIEANITTAVSGLQSAGYAVLVGTVMPSLGFVGEKETKRTDLNAWIAAQAATQGYTVVDFAAHSDLDDASNATFFSDGTHLTDAGYAVMADLVAAAINAAL